MPALSVTTNANGWQEMSLGDFCEIYQPKTISRKQMVEDGEYPVFGANGIIGRYNEYNHENSELLITCRGATCGSVNISLPKSWITGNAMVVRPNETLVLRRYLEYAFQGPINLSSVITGSAQPQITRTNLSPVRFAFPSLSEQQRVVGILDEAFDNIKNSIEQSKQKIHDIRELMQSEIDSIYSDSEGNWIQTTVGEICEIKHGFAFKGKNFTKDISSSSPIVLTPGNFTENADLFFTEKNTKRLLVEPPKDLEFEIGDLVIVMTDLSSKMKILGKPAIINRKDILHNQRIGKILINNNSILPKFLYYFFQTNCFLRTIKSTATGTMVRHTSPKRIYQTNISYPSSIDEQNMIVTKLDELKNHISDIELNLNTELNALDELISSILQLAFNGTLRVAEGLAGQS